MIMPFFGIIDLIAAGLIYINDIPGPSLLINLVILTLVIKGVMSLISLFQ